MILVFETFYLCEQVFSWMKHTESPARSMPVDSHLEDCLRVVTTTFKPGIMKQEMPSIALMVELEINFDFSNCFYNRLMWPR